MNEWGVCDEVGLFGSPAAVTDAQVAFCLGIELAVLVSFSQHELREVELSSSAFKAFCILLTVSS